LKNANRKLKELKVQIENENGTREREEAENRLMQYVEWMYGGKKPNRG
jgi:hypothetical protein